MAMMTTTGENADVLTVEEGKGEVQQLTVPRVTGEQTYIIYDSHFSLNCFIFFVQVVHADSTIVLPH